MKLNSWIMILLISFIGMDIIAQGEDKSESPYFEVITDDGSPISFPLKSTSAEVDIVGVIADVRVKQLYQNKSKQAIEAIYVFPGSTRAAVYAMRMKIGERIIEATIQEKAKAREAYDKARKEGKSASLLEQKRPNVFQMNVANIMPGDLIEVELNYTESLIPEEGLYEFVFPTVVGPRFSNGNEGQATNAADGWVQNPYTSEGVAPLYDFNITVEVNAGMPLSDLRCSTHDVAVNWMEEDRVRLDLKEHEKDGGNRDYILQYRLRGNKIHSGLLLYEGKEENFFMAMVQPPKRVEEMNIPPREYVFIVDVSGSMRGYPLTISKKLLTDLIGGLRPTDKFNVLFFSSSNAVLSESSLFATPENTQKALNMMSSYSGGGGTQLLPALQKALAMGGTEDYSRSFVIATDGYVTVERQAFDLIRNNLGNANFFAFGIGSSVNRHLMEGMAHIGKGVPFIISSQQEAPQIADRFRKYINEPVLTNIKVRFEGFNAYDVEPSSIPDVLAERPVMITGKWKGEPKGRLVVEGKSGDGRFTQSFDISSGRSKGDTKALRYLWARERIRLLDDYASAGFDNEEQQREVLALGLKYSLMTRFTSFLAIDSEIRNNTGQVVTINQPLPLPHGVSNNASGNLINASAGASSNFGSFKPTNKAMVITREEVKRRGDAMIIEDEVVLDLVENEIGINEPQIFTVVEKMPEFIGGQDRLMNFIKQNFHYPESMKISGITGTIYLSFVIETDGRVSDVRVLRGLYPLLDQAAIEVIKLTSGQWKPGEQRGKAVRVSYRIPVKVLP